MKAMTSDQIKALNALRQYPTEWLQVSDGGFHSSAANFLVRQGLAEKRWNARMFRCEWRLITTE